jgi:hypothetical protein
MLRLISDEVASIARDLARDRVALDREANERRREDETGQCEGDRGEIPTEAKAPRPSPLSRAHPRIMRYE